MKTTMVPLEVNRIIVGDALPELKNLPAESIDCVMTSPPYWGLRDYGTATWEGGDTKCDHMADTLYHSKSGLNNGRKHDRQKPAGVPYKGDCGKCGAIRIDKQLGLEPDFRDYIENLCLIFDEVKRVLKPTGTCWVNLGDTYGGSGNGYGGVDHGKLGKHANDFLPPPSKSGIPNKSLVQIPSRFAIAMTDRGWILRNEIIWYKKNVMPASVKDRFTVDFEKVFFFTKSKHYWFEQQRESANTDNRLNKGNHRYKSRHTPVGVTVTDSRNKRTVWQINPQPFSEAHFAVFPPKLCETPIKSGCPPGGIVLDPFFGAGTTGLVAEKLGRQWLGIELRPKYAKIAEKRIHANPVPML